MAEPKMLPRRCKTCGGKGYWNVPVDGSGKTEKKTCSDCYGTGTKGYVICE